MPLLRRRRSITHAQKNHDAVRLANGSRECAPDDRLRVTHPAKLTHWCSILTLTAEDDPTDEISLIEERLEELAEVSERCRKIILVSKAAIAGGVALLLVMMLGLFGSSQVAALGSIAAVLGGIVSLGSNVSTLRQTTDAISAAEALRSDLISRIDLRVVGDSPEETELSVWQRRCVGWAKRSVPTIQSALEIDGGHASLCPPYEAILSLHPGATRIERRRRRPVREHAADADLFGQHVQHRQRIAVAIDR